MRLIDEQYLIFNEQLTPLLLKQRIGVLNHADRDEPQRAWVGKYFEREVKPHAPDAWIDHEKTKVGYEIPFNRHFYVFKPPRPLAEIDAELKGVTDNILRMIGGLTA